MYAKVPVRFQTPNSSLQVIEILPFKRLLEREGENFIRQHYTDVELSVNYIGERRIQYLAGRWAAKKAIIDILGNQDSISWLNIEILRLPTGQPSVTLFSQCQAIATRLRIEKWLLSISHTTTHAVASVVAIQAICPLIPPTLGDFKMISPQNWRATPRRRKTQGNAREGARGAN